LIAAHRRRLSALRFGLALAGLAAGSRPEAAHAVPSYARQLDMPCNGWHVQFPVLNAFGQAPLAA
jgi:hypothetical protein